MLSSRPAVLEAFVRNLREGASVREVTTDRLPEEITGLLDQLTVSLRAAEIGENATLLPVARDLAAELGEAGAHEGRRIDEVVSDFLALHEAIVEVVGQQGPPLAPGEQRVLVRGFNRAIAAAVTRYAKARDREVQRAHAEHFAFLAHELRTPLSNIKMGVELLADGLDAAALIPRVRRSADRLGELLDNEITNARLLAGAPLHREPVALGELLDAIVEESRMQAHDRDIEIVSRVPGDLRLNADPRLLRSVFTNLLVNAVKFSKTGSSIAVAGRDDGDHVECTVADGCGGLPEGTASKMFGAFKQTGTDRSGFGLGLAIVSEAVGVHGGTIHVEDRPGEGCTMVVRLPYGQVSAD